MNTVLFILFYPVITNPWGWAIALWTVAALVKVYRWVIVHPDHRPGPPKPADYWPFQP